MIPAKSERPADVFGLFELDDDGNVLYSRPRLDGQLGHGSNEMIGRNFFQEVATFENREELRRHFRRFVTGAEPADVFTFDCFYGNETVKAKVSMIRARESDLGHAAGIVIMDIKNAGT